MGTSPETLMFNSSSIIPKLHRNFNEFRGNSKHNVALQTRKALYTGKMSLFITAYCGKGTLQLEASDGEYAGSDTVTINVYNDSCEAAQSLPDYVPLVGDLNGDCKVDDADMTLLQENWLMDNSLTDDWLMVN